MKMHLMALALLLCGCAASDLPPRAAAGDQAAQLFQAQMELGRAYLRRGDLPRAEAKLELALGAQPDAALALTSLGLVHQLRGEDAQAEARFKAALERQPELAEARNNYGVYLLSRQRPREAIAQLQAAAGDAAYPNRVSALENLGRAQLAAGDRPAAEQSFRHAVQLNPAQSGALLELAQLTYDRESYAEARDHYRQHEALASPSARSLWLCVRLSRIFKEDEEEASCGLALAAFPASQEYKNYQAGVLLDD